MKLIPIQTREMGCKFIIPNSHIEAQIFPTRVILRKLDQSAKIFDISITGPVNGFKVESDLQKGFIRVSMQFQNGFLKYKLFALEDSIKVQLEKSPLESLEFAHLKIKRKETLDLISCEVHASSKAPLLFLGSMKKKDASDVWREKNLATLLPWLFYLSRASVSKNHAASLSDFAQSFYSDKRKVLQFFELSLSAFFQGFFSPSTNDLTYQGLKTFFEEKVKEIDILSLYHELISNLFFDYENNSLKFLPHCPGSFHQGKLLDLEFENFTLSFSWSRGRIREVTIQAKSETKIELDFPKSIRNFHIKNTKNEKILGHILKINLKADETLELHNFNK